MEFPDAHDVILVLVEGAEHAVRLFVCEVEFCLEHRHRLVVLQSTHVVLDVAVKDLLNLLTTDHTQSK